MNAHLALLLLLAVVLVGFGVYMTVGRGSGWLRRSPVAQREAAEMDVRRYKARRQLQSQILAASVRHDAQRLIREGRQEIADLHRGHDRRAGRWR